MSTYTTTSVLVIGTGVTSATYNSSNFSTVDLNATQPRDPDEDFYRYLEAMTTPVVCVVGTVLNLLTVGAFLSKPLRKISCSLYLAVRSLAVFGFLVSMFLAWTNTFTPLVQKEGVCQLTVFLSYICPFVSVWMVVIISVENFIRISRPARVGLLCTPRMAKFVILIVIAIGLMVYNFPLWAIGVHNGNCSEKPSLVKAVIILNNVDIMLTLLCPFILMIIVVPLVGLSAIQAYERKKRLNSDLQSRKRATADLKCSPETRVTHLLLAVSVVFLLFHIPFHAIRIKVFFLTLARQVPSKLDKWLFHVFRLLFNFDTVFSCAVYMIFGDNFRRVFCSLYFSRCRHVPSSKPTDPATADQSTQYTPLTQISCVEQDNGGSSGDHHLDCPDGQAKNNDVCNEEAKLSQNLLCQQ